MRIVNESQVRSRTEQLKQAGSCQSSDAHVIALAQVSQARLLYSNDKALRGDFKDKALIDNPEGKVYSTRLDGKFRNAHKKLLRMKNLCKNG